MTLKAILFDVNGTLVDIETDENRPRLWEGLSWFLKYKGIYFEPEKLKNIYYKNHEDVYRQSEEEHPETNVIIVWQKILYEYENKELYDLKLDTESGEQLVKDVVQMFRALSLKKLNLYNDVYNTLIELQKNYKLGVVSNAQHCWTSPELKMLNIKYLFDSIALSSDYGFCKPDARLFQVVLDELQVTQDESIFVGNDTHSDILGATNVGLKSILHMTHQGEKDFTYAVPDYKIDHFKELINVIKSLES